MAKSLRLVRGWRRVDTVDRTCLCHVHTCELAISSQDHTKYTPTASESGERERAVTSSSRGRDRVCVCSVTVGDVSCLFSCVLFQIQCTVVIWLGSGLCLWLSRDSSLTRASWVWHSPHTLCQCLCRVRGGGGRARAPFLPPPASAQRPRLPAPRPHAGPARARVAPSAPCARAPCE